MKGDPFWMTAKFKGKCATPGCTDLIYKNDRIYWYPNVKKAYVGECANKAARDFGSITFDEMVNEGAHVR